MEPEEIQGHNEREDFVIKFMTKATEEISSVFAKDNNGRSFIPDRSKLILVFTAVDILYTYWQKYLNITGEATYQKSAFPAWLDEFCFTEKNNTFLKNEELKKINSQKLYCLRNSLVHFYGLPRKIDNVNLMIISDRVNDKFIDGLVNKFDASNDGVNIIIKPKIIRDLIWDGGILMMEKMINNLRINPEEHVAGIKRVYDEAKSRGAASIIIEK